MQGTNPDLKGATPATVLRARDWSVDEVATLLDTPPALVTRWCVAGLLPGARRCGDAWAIPGRGLFVFCQRRVEAHYSPETAAALLDRSVATIRDWIKDRRLKVIKTGTAKSAGVLIPESELRRWLAA